MKGKPQIIYYYKKVVSPVLFNGKQVSRSMHHSVNVPDMLAEELYYSYCSDWVMYSNRIDIVTAWNKATLEDELPLQAFQQQPFGGENNPNFPTS